MNYINQLLKGVDAFATPISVGFRSHEGAYSTRIGGIITFAVYSCLIAALIQNTIQMINYENASIIAYSASVNPDVYKGLNFRDLDYIPALKLTSKYFSEPISET